MAVAVRFVVTVIQPSLVSRGQAVLGAGVGIAVGVPVFISLALAWQLFSIREWLTIPGGKQLLKLAQKLKR